MDYGKFLRFLKRLETDENKPLIETVTHGFISCLEADYSSGEFTRLEKKLIELGYDFELLIEALIEMGYKDRKTIMNKLRMIVDSGKSFGKLNPEDWEESDSSKSDTSKSS